MNKKFESVAKAKISQSGEFTEKMEKIHERRSLKEEKKEQVLKGVDVNH
jgi:hypothetical protein|tara:strand:+ start:811 stop:957 length:147 start_codon:yes stop_codon:yes gene_type:complete